MDELIYVSEYINIILLTTLVGIEIYVMFNVRIANFDKTALAIIGAYTMCMATKAASLIIYSQSSGEANGGKDIIDLLNMATDIIVWTLLYFFVFEMRAVADIVESSSHTDY